MGDSPNIVSPIGRAGVNDLATDAVVITQATLIHVPCRTVIVVHVKAVVFHRISTKHSGSFTQTVVVHRNATKNRRISIE
jgi:hypothetical protein